LSPFPENPEVVMPEALLTPVPDVAAGPLPEIVHERPPLPSWWDVFVLVLLTVLSVVLLLLSMIAAILAAKGIYPHLAIGAIVRMPLIAVFGQAGAYLLILACMYVLVTRVQRRPDFLVAIHWNWPVSSRRYVVAGFVLSLSLQALSHLLPIPKNLPIDSFFRTPLEAWVLSIFGVTLAPLMEELYFRGFLYPVFERYIGMAAAFVLNRRIATADAIVKRCIAMPAAIVLTAAPFALLHGAQLKFAWGPVLVIFLVGAALGAVRAATNSVAAGLIVHIAYNATISILMFAATGGFRHLERLNQ
jgi:uncharacterized protein